MNPKKPQLYKNFVLIIIAEAAFAFALVGLYVTGVITDVSILAGLLVVIAFISGIALITAIKKNSNIYCPSCKQNQAVGRTFPLDSKFCRYCGFSLKN